jgi:hypothetical protein
MSKGAIPMKNKSTIALPEPQTNYGPGNKLQFYGEPNHPVYVEKLATFTVTSDGQKWDVAIFPGGEVTLGMRVWKLRIKIPDALIGQETIIAQVSEPQAPEKTAEAAEEKSTEQLWANWEKINSQQRG